VNHLSTSSHFRCFVIVKKLTLIFGLCLFAFSMQSQNENDKTNTDSVERVIQFSGVVVTHDPSTGEMIPLPYTTISIDNSSRGTYSEIDGFFSIVAEVGDSIVFSRIGYQTAKHGISDTLDSSFYSWYQVMSKDDYLLPTAVIYPWPSKEHYKIEFLALDVSNELAERAKRNLATELIERMEHAVPPDGTEAFTLENAKQVYEYKYSGQYKPQNIGNVAAWAQFIKAWRRGDFKRKKKKK